MVVVAQLRLYRLAQPVELVLGVSLAKLHTHTDPEMTLLYSYIQIIELTLLTDDKLCI